MLERHMEDLIALYPDQFFPRHELKLTGRQQSFHGVGRFDLLFVDRHGMHILMELKAVPAKYEVIDQIARYRDALADRGLGKFIMYVVAPVIPHGLREFLSHLGIEYAEIHESEFTRVADDVGYSLDSPNDPAPAAANSSPAKSDQPVRESKSIRLEGETGIDEWGFGLGTQPSFLIKALEDGRMTKEELRSSFMSHFYPNLDISAAKRKSGFGVFFSDSKRPVGTYHASRALSLVQDSTGRLSLEAERTSLVKTAIKNGILTKLRGLHFQRNKVEFNEVQNSFGLPIEP